MSRARAGHLPAGLVAVGLGIASTGATPAAAQRVTELGLEAVGTLSDTPLAAGGAYAGLRITDRTRLALTLNGGASEGQAAFRGELLGHFLLAPRATLGAGFYGMGGIALVRGRVDQGYVVLGVGLEARPGVRSGWAIEAGVGGGVRLSLGYRWRWFPRALAAGD